MTLKQKFQEIKNILTSTAPADAPQVNTPPVNTFTDYTLADGTVISIDNLQVGGNVQIGGLPAPDGTYSLPDGTAITTVGGAISTITPPATQPAQQQQVAPAVIPQTPQQMMAAFDANPDIKTIAVITKALFENVFGWQLKEAENAATREAAIEAYRNGFTKQQSAFEKLLALVEEIIKEPVADPIETPKNNFSADVKISREQKTQSLTAALKELKNK